MEKLPQFGDKMELNITYWDYSTWRPCDICGDKPESDWMLATVNGKRHCMNCLGDLVTRSRMEK